MTFEKGDEVVLSDKHSDYDGELGTVTQVTTTMFDDKQYTLEFEDGGQETGIPPAALSEPEDESDDTPSSDG